MSDHLDSKPKAKSSRDKSSSLKKPKIASSFERGKEGWRQIKAGTAEHALLSPQRSSVRTRISVACTPRPPGFEKEDFPQVIRYFSPSLFSFEYFARQIPENEDIVYREIGGEAICMMANLSGAGNYTVWINLFFPSPTLEQLRSRVAS